jgi:3-phenylpropionate/trans-cinnamate dioxygenase ferredoxin subunit
MSEFVTVGALADLSPGGRWVVEAQHTWIVILNIDGALYAVEDMCSHEEYELSGGALDGFALECPKHHAAFDVRTGKPTLPPAVAPIRRFAVRVEDGMVQVGGRLKP